jgi:hypothetical protein
LCPKCQAERPPKEVIQEELDKNPFFITESLSTEVSSQNKGKLSRRQQGLYQSQVLHEGSQHRLNENSLLMEPSSLLNIS